MPTEILFEEKQHMHQTWVILLTLVAVIVPMSIGVFPLLNGELKEFHDIILGVLALAIFFPIFLGMYYAFLTTRIDEDKIAYGWNIPTNELNVIKWSDIQDLEILEYRFVGYGYRLSPLYGTVYNASGNKGLQITKKNGEKLLIGSNKVKELQQTLACITQNKALFSGHAVFNYRM